MPSLDEQGLPGYDLAAWVGLSGPAGMPRDIVRRINADVSRHFESPAVRERVKQLGFTPLKGTPEEFTAFVDKEYTQWGQAIAAAKIEPQ